MRMRAAEFDRRYALRPDITKAELVQGVVYVASPVRIEEHAEPDFLMATWLGHYALTHTGVRGGSNGTVRLSDDDRVQPDQMLWKAGSGRAVVAEDSYMDGAPELVVEVAASSASYDLHAKLESYERAGVQEYIVWVTEDEQLLWFEWVDGRFQELPAGNDGWTESRVFPGLRLHAGRLLEGDFSVLLPGASQLADS